MRATVGRLLAVAAGAVLGAALAPGAATSAWTGAGVVGGLAAVAVATEVLTLRVAPRRLLGGGAGAVAGVVAGVALATGLAPLLPAASLVVPAGLCLVGGGLGAVLGARAVATDAKGQGPARLLDTSAIIDGRIADVAAAGALDGDLVVPRFVLRELQSLADASDTTRRQRGRRGLDVLDRLRRDRGLVIDETDVPGIADVDGKLVALARSRGGRLVTGDTALARVAALSGVAVLNVHDLAAALRPAVIPGQSMPVHLVRPGKEPGQGIGYLDDGTMVVVEGGTRRLGQGVDVVVTSVLPTAAGRIAFARLRDEDAAGA